MTIAREIETIQDYLGDDVEVAQRVRQLSWMLFLKVVSDREIKKEKVQPGYTSPLPHELRWYRLLSFGDPGPLEEDKLLPFIDKTLLPGLRRLPGTDPVSTIVRTVFANAANYAKNRFLLRDVVTRITALELFPGPPSRDDIGRAYEQLLEGLRVTSDSGEVHTPRALTQFIVEQLDPQLGETFLDPACGTGGFLMSAVEHLRLKSGSADDRIIQAAVRGAEANHLSYYYSAVNMVLHGLDADTRIECADALSRLLEAPAKSDPVDIVLTHPPVGEVVAYGVEDHVPAPFRTRDATDLFLYLVMTQLRAGGRAAVVVPDGLLRGEGVTTRLKEKLLEECDLHTIVRLPSGVLSPQTGIKTSVLFFVRGKPTEAIWYYEHPYPPGYKKYSKTKPLRGEDFDPERRWWKKRRETSQAWKVTLGEIKARNYNLDVRRPAAGAGEGPSRVRSLTLRGFRGFKSLDIALPDDGPAVLIGANGAGKSTVLESMAMLFSAFAALASGLTTRQADVTMDEKDVNVDSEGASVGATVRVGEGEQFWDIRLNRVRGAPAPSKEIARQAETLKDRFLRGRVASLPVLCFYPATRGLGDGAAQGKRVAHRFAQLEAYSRSFGRGLGPFRDLVQWFREEEDAENERRLRVDPEYRNPQLEAVRQALERFLSALGSGSFSNLRMERPSADEGTNGTTRPAELVLDKDGERLGLQQLSEGERNTVLLVSDLARRLSIANPALEDPLQGPGIALIDEIDLHLHPPWQRAILPALSTTFPGLQLILSTHSPQVLSRVKREHVFILDGFQLVAVAPHTYGHDANSILGEVFGLPERPRRARTTSAAKMPSSTATPREATLRSR